MRKILLILAAMGCLYSPGFAEDAAVVTQQLLQDTMDRGTEILTNGALSVDQKMEAFEVLLKERCHTELMAKLVLGKSGWAALTEEQKPEFVSAFIQMVTRSYYNKLNMADVSVVKIAYGENEELSPVKRTLKAQVSDASMSYGLEYNFAQIDGRWGIYDLKIEGISLLASYRAEYSDYLVQNSGESLIALLKQKAADAQANGAGSGGE